MKWVTSAWTLLFSTFFGVILTPSVARCTHLMGGEMSVVHIGENAAGVPLYEVHCFVYRDCSSANTNGTDFDLVASVGVYANGDLVEEMLLPLEPNLVENIVPENPNACAFLPEDLCLERAEYIGTVALPASAIGYDFVYQRCCRSPAITNLVTPQDQGFTIRTNLPPTSVAAPGNSTPVFNDLPQAFVCNQYPFAISHAATDADGDSVAYHLCDIFLGGDVMAPMPAPPLPPPFAPVVWEAGYNGSAPFGIAANVDIDPLTGTMTGMPLLVGKYSVGICVEEWRDGILIGAITRDFTIDVVTCEVLAPVYNSVASCDGLEVSFEQFNTPADNYVWDFGVDDVATDTSSAAEPNYMYDEPGIYEISLFFSSGGCSDSLFFTVGVAEPWVPEFELGEESCGENETWWVPIAVDSSAWPPGTEWTLTFGSTISGMFPDEIPLPPGSTEVALSTSWADCVSEWAVEVDLAGMPTASFSMTSDPCSEPEATFAVDDPESGPFSWTFGGSSSGQTGAVVTQNFPTYGSYDISLTAGVGTPCEATTSQTIILYPPDPFAGSIDVYPLSVCNSIGWMEVLLSGMGVDDVQWELPAEATIDTTSNTGATLLLSTPGVYPATVTLINSACNQSESIAFDIDVPAPIESVDYFVPNVFTPNNDALNERFAVMRLLEDGELVNLPSPSNFTTFDFRIFNRWGDEVFATSNPSAGWRGTDAAEGTYYWTLDAHHLCDSGPASLHGVTSLLR